MIDRIECSRASIIGTTTRDSNYADACLILKAGCSLEKWPRILGMIITPFDKMQTSRDAFRR